MDRYETTREEMEYHIHKTLDRNTKQIDGEIIKMIEPQYITCDPKEKTIIMEYPVQKWQLNPGGILHGGITSTIFDTTFGLLVHSLVKEKMITTVSLTVQFLKPIAPGEVIEVHAKINSIGSTMAYVTGEIRLKSNEKIAATACGAFMILKQNYEGY